MISTIAMAAKWGQERAETGQKYIRRTLTTDYVNKRLKTFDKADWEADIDLYKSLDFTRSFKNDDQRIPMPPQDKINEVLKVIGKKEDEAHRGLRCLRI